MLRAVWMLFSLPAAVSQVTISFPLDIVATSSFANEFLCELPNANESFVQSGYKFLELPKVGDLMLNVSGCARVRNNTTPTPGPTLPPNPETIAPGCKSFEAARPFNPYELCTVSCTHAFNYFELPVSPTYSSHCQCDTATKCIDGASWPVDASGNLAYGSANSNSAWYEATRSNAWKYSVAVCGNGCGCSCWLGCTPDMYDPCSDSYLGDLSVNQINQYLYDGYPARRNLRALQTANPKYSIDYVISGFDNMDAAIDEARRIRTLAANMGLRVQAAFESEALIVLTANNQIVKLGLDEPVDSSQPQSLIGSLTYVDSLPSDFASCASKLLSGSFGSGSYESEVESIHQIDLHAEVPAGGDRAAAFEEMSSLVTGRMLTECASVSNVNVNDIPLVLSQEVTAVATTPKPDGGTVAGLPWYGWLLIALAVLLLISIGLYLWWLLAARRRERDGVDKNGGQAGVMGAASGEYDDEAAAVAAMEALSSQRRRSLNAHMLVPTAAVAVNQDGSMTPTLPLAPKNFNIRSPNSAVSRSLAPPDSGYRERHRSHEAPY